MKTLLTFLLGGIFLLLTHTQAKACDLDPTAVIEILPDEVVFLVGDTIYMEAYNSSPNCGYISRYRWQVDGVTESTSGYFIPSLTLQSGEDSRSFDIQLRVQNSVGNYGYETVTITIVSEHSSYYYLTDHLGSVRVTVDDDGNSVGWDDYYPFGLQMPGRTQNASNPNDDAKFTGYELEQQGDLGLYHAVARMYDPVIGRFMQIDPLTDDPAQVSFSPYNYTWNNPMNLIDPDGKCPKPSNTNNTVCVALFIQSDTALDLKGDGRDFSSSSEPSKSRLYVHIDIDSQKITTQKINETCNTDGECAPPLDEGNSIYVEFSDDGSFELRFTAKNSMREISPDINGAISFIPDGEGGFDTKGDRDAYPSAEGYHWKGGEVKTLFQKKEKNPFYLFFPFPNQIWDYTKN